jgi:exopolysaccharide biosynthesis polyprenyl glycosylphosphotransferase
MPFGPVLINLTGCLLALAIFQQVFGVRQVDGLMGSATHPTLTISGLLATAGFVCLFTMGVRSGSSTIDVMGNAGRNGVQKYRYSSTDNNRVPSDRIRAVVVGAGNIGRTLAKHLEAGGRYHVVGFIDDGVDPIEVDRHAILGGREEASTIIEQYAIAELFVAYAPSWQQRLAEQLSLSHPDVQLRIVPTAYESMMRPLEVESYGDIAVVQLSPPSRRLQSVAKRVFDIVVAVAGLILAIPVGAISIALIKVTSRGPAIFAQVRTGRQGKPFWLYKLRTMRVDAEEATGAVLSSGKDDPRLTRVGRWLRLFRIDEIPQLWNVLRGDMSIVGPRPERPCFTQVYDKCIPAYSRRHDVNPGITGLAQVLAGYHTDARDKLRFDLIYIAHQSIWLDLAVIMRTLRVVLVPEPRQFERNNAASA